MDMAFGIKYGKLHLATSSGVIQTSFYCQMIHVLQNDNRSLSLLEFGGDSNVAPYPYLKL